MGAERRARRMQQVLSERLATVQCAIEHVHHRHNVSAILRTCDALGIHRVRLVGEQTFAAVNAISRGADRWLDIHRHDTIAEAVAAIRADGARLYVADLADDAVAPRDVPIDRPVCLWFGAELIGVDPEARAAADGVVTIPMRGMAQSLNVSVASALALEPVAQRVRTEHPAPGLSDAVRHDTLVDWLARDAADRETGRRLAEALES